MKKAGPVPRPPAGPAAPGRRPLGNRNGNGSKSDLHAFQAGDQIEYLSSNGVWLAALITNVHPSKGTFDVKITDSHLKAGQDPHRTNLDASRIRRKSSPTKPPSTSKESPAAAVPVSTRNGSNHQAAPVNKSRPVESKAEEPEEVEEGSVNAPASSGAIFPLRLRRKALFSLPPSSHSPMVTN